MQPVSSYFFLWVLCNPFLGTTKPVISLSDPSLCTTMQPVTLLQPIYFLSIGYYTIPHFIIGYHDYATLSGIMQPVLLSLTCYFINFCAPFSTRIIVCYLAHYFVSVESYWVLYSLVCYMQFVIVVFWAISHGGQAIILVHEIHLPELILTWLRHQRLAPLQLHVPLLVLMVVNYFILFSFH